MKKSLDTPKAMKRHRVWLGFALWALACVALAGESEAPALLENTRGATEAAGIGQLSASNLADGESELRIWSGFGTYPVNRMLRLRIGRDGQVRGEVLMYYASDLDWMDTDEARRFRREVLGDCVNLKRGRDTDVCTFKHRRKPDWHAVHQRVLALGILSLPDESKLPPPEIDIIDGSAMVVEIKDGAAYRAYQYSNAWARSEPEAVAADRIMRALSSSMLP